MSHVAEQIGSAVVVVVVVGGGVVVVEVVVVGEHHKSPSPVHSDSIIVPLHTPFETRHALVQLYESHDEDDPHHKSPSPVQLTSVVPSSHT